MDFEEVLSKIKDDTADYIYIERRKLTEKNVTDLSEALKNNKSLCGLTLNNNPSEETANIVVSDSQLKPILESIKIHPNLFYVNVQNNNIGDEGLGYVADLLMNNSRIATCNLGGNNIGKAGAATLSQVIDLTQGSKCSLTQLHLNNISTFGDDGAIAIAAGLSKNNKITTVHLNETQISSIGIKALASALEQEMNTTNSLNLNGNKIDDEGAKALLHALKVKPIISAVDVGDNNISDANIQNINKILAESPKERQDLRDLTRLQDQLPATGADDKLDESILKAVETKNQLPAPVKDVSLAPVVDPVIDNMKQVNQISGQVINKTSDTNTIVADKATTVTPIVNQATDTVNQLPNQTGQAINNALPTNEQIMKSVDNTYINPVVNQVVDQAIEAPFKIEQTIDNTLLTGSDTKNSMQDTVQNNVPPLSSPSLPNQADNNAITVHDDSQTTGDGINSMHDSQG